ncbi:alpha/beta fold hydrolase [Longitalea luteola]|uniref:alpha/beta fold hydrolase n=1 Tax=Longitalea luteola TaxID=2812563 RepID=UPI00210491F1|nr:alpha/beta fold hydrolase [Longitalea luteola]
MTGVDAIAVSFDSNGSNCSGRLYLPISKTDKLACVVFANGFSGTMDWILPDFAERFAKAGFAAFIFDYRYLGESDGEPRQVIDTEKQRTDLKNAVTWVRNQPGIDKTRIALWGTSMGASHVVQTASTDHDIAAVICNVPALDARKGTNVKAKAKAANASQRQIITSTVRLLGAAIFDSLRNLFGLPPFYIKVYGKAGEAIFTDPSLAHRFKILAEGSPTWQNKVAARVLFKLPSYKNGTIERIKAPICVSLSTKDVEVDNNFVKKIFSRSPNAEIREYPYDHFTMYHEEGFETVVTDQLSFLKKHLERGT